MIRLALAAFVLFLLQLGFAQAQVPTSDQTSDQTQTHARAGEKTSSPTPP